MQGIKKKLSRGMELYVCLHLDYFFCQTGIQVGKIAPILEQLTFVLWHSMFTKFLVYNITFELGGFYDSVIRFKCLLDDCIGFKLIDNFVLLYPALKLFLKCLSVNQN